MLGNNMIFYTEDDIDDQLIFKDVLDDLGCSSKLHFQNDGEELLTALKHRSVIPDIIFLDLNMPKKNGFEILEEIRSLKGFRNLPVIILSTAANEMHAARAKKMGANLYMTKPQSLDDFRELMQRVLSVDWKKKRSENKVFYVNANV